MTAYEVTSNHVPPYAGSGLPVTEVLGILHRLDPAAVQEAGGAHTTLGRELDTMAAHLTREAQTLAQSWSGRAARTALAQLQRLREQTATLSAQATQTGAVLTWLGTQVLPSFKDLTDTSAAQKYLSELSSALILANGSLPAQIGGTAPAQLASAAAPGTSATRSSLTGSSPTAPASPGSPASLANPGSLIRTNSPASPGAGNPTGPATPASTAPADTISPAATTGRTGPAVLSGHASPQASRLQSAVPAPAPGTPAAPASPPAPAVPATATTGTPAPVPLVTTASPRTTGAARRSRPSSHHDTQPAAKGAPSADAVSATSTAAPAPGLPAPEFPAAEAPALSAHPLPELTGLDSAGLNGAGLDSGLSGGALPLPAQPAAGALPAAPAAVATPDPGTPASHGVLGGLPMTGGVSGQPDHERHRDSWASEDRNLWGLPDACVPPLIEGG